LKYGENKMMVIRGRRWGYRTKRTELQRCYVNKSGDLRCNRLTVKILYIGNLLRIEGFLAQKKKIKRN
jgi:hypothetical protein